MMKNNKKLLDKLQAELDLIKSSKAKIKTSKTKVQPITETHKSSVAHDIKNSYIQNLHMRSSMFMLWLATAVLSYAHKIPYIKHIITMLSVMYGRTTIWKVLVKLRKIFIMFNAIIGVFMVYKTVGFNYENVLAGFAGMGHSYLEIFTNFSKRLFNWFVELFDYKVIPNVPGDVNSGNNTYKKIWSSGPLDKTVYHPTNIVPTNVEDSLRKSYNSLFNISVEPTPSSWFKDLPTWLWVGGVVAGGAVVLGSVYVIYKFIQDPSFILFLGKAEGTAGADVANAAAANVRTTVTPASPEGTVESSLALKITKGLVRGVVKGIRKLNPSYWFLTSTDTAEQAREFLSQQATTNRLQDYYPYTEVNPYDSWFKRMRLSWLGEHQAEKIDRKMLAKSWLDEMSKHAHVAPVASGSTLTPHVATVGLGISMDSGFQSVAERLYSVPSTPGLRPLAHLMTDEMGNAFQESELRSAVGRLQNLPFTEELDDVITEGANKYSVLEVEETAVSSPGYE